MGVRFAVHSPYIVHELTPRKYVVGRGRQLEQEEELLLRELCFLAASMDGQRVAVKNCIAQLCPALTGDLGSAQQGLHSPYHLIDINWLDHIIICADAETFSFIRRLDTNFE